MKTKIIKTKVSNGATIEYDGIDWYYLVPGLVNRINETTELYPEALNKEVHESMEVIRAKFHNKY